MKKTLILLASVICSTGLFAMASDCPGEAAKCNPEMKEKCAAKGCRDQKKCPEAKCPVKNGKMQNTACPRMKKSFNRNADRKAPRMHRPQISPEMKAEFEKFRSAIKAYKENKTPENKAKVIEILGKQFDKRLEMSKKRAEAMKKMAADIEKKNDEMSKNRDAEIEKMLEKIMNPPQRPMRRNNTAPKAPAAAPAA